MMSTMTPNQLELRFEAQVIPANSSASNPASRSAWWFSQMRRVVAMTIEWKPTPPPRPEQSFLALQSRRA